MSAFTFGPFEQTCNLAVLAPSQTIPGSGGTAATATASAANPGASTSNAISTPAAPLGNATLSIVSGFANEANTPNPLAGHPCTSARRVCRHRRQSRGHSPRGNLAVQICRDGVRESHARVSNSHGCNQGERRLGSSRRRQRQRHFSRRASRTLLSDDFSAPQKSSPRLGPSRSTQTRSKLPDSR
jgi:hypothetical protein